MPAQGLLPAILFVGAFLALALFFTVIELRWAQLAYPFREPERRRRR